MPGVRWPGCASILSILIVLAAADTEEPLTAGRAISCRAFDDSDGMPQGVSCEGTHYVVPGLGLARCNAEDVDPGTVAFWQRCIFSVLCVFCSALAAGLTLGITSLDEFKLKILTNKDVDEVETGASQEEREVAQERLKQDQLYAQKVLPVITGKLFRGRRSCIYVPSQLNPSNGHVVLVTLLLLNAAANEALPLFLGGVVPEWVAVILSVTVVLVFGEILPSAVFTGPKQLRLAASLSPVVSAAKLLLLPLVWPIALILDQCLGHTEDQHNRAEIKAIIRTLKQECLELDEVNMIHGVLEMHHKTAGTIGIPLERAKMLAHDDLLTEGCVETLRSWGHSRILVFRRHPEESERCDDVMGVLLVRKLLGLDLSIPPRVETLALWRPVVLDCSDNLLNSLNRFQDNMCHIAVICPNRDAAQRALDLQYSIPLPARPTMFCSLTDIIEQLLKEEVLDENDAENMRPQLTRSWTARSSYAQGLSSLFRWPISCNGEEYLSDGDFEYSSDLSDYAASDSPPRSSPVSGYQSSESGCT